MIAVPPLLPGGWRGIIVEHHEIAGTRLAAVTVKPGLGRAPRRRWFADSTVALAHALDQAETLALPLLHLGVEGE